MKDETKQKQIKFQGNPPFGFVAYPVSQAADILISRSEIVPVGDDQSPMIELTNHIGRKFNKVYKTNTFNEVKAIYTDFTRLVGTDGNAKMSKSLNNCIYLADSPEVVKDKVMKMYTDPNRIRATDPGKVEGNPVFIYHDAFNTNFEEVEDLKNRYKKGQVGDIEVKQKLINAINDFLEPIRERRKYYEKNTDVVQDILKKGNDRIKDEGLKTMEIVKEAMKINYF